MCRLLDLTGEHNNVEKGATHGPDADVVLEEFIKIRKLVTSLPEQNY
jgi:hypothetical protein